MKTIIRLVFAGIMLLMSSAIMAQTVEARLDEAQAAYRSGDLEGARFALQQAMNEVDLAIGREVLGILPDQLGNMPKVDAGDNVASASMGFAGLYVKRQYRSDGPASADLQILADSPLLAGINAILALPFITGDANQKRIRVANYRALMQRSEDSNGTVSWDIQVPFGSSLMTLQIKGIDNENDVVAMANTIPVDQVARLIQ